MSEKQGFNVTVLTQEGSYVSTQLWQSTWLDVQEKVERWLKEKTYNLSPECPVVVKPHAGRAHFFTVAVLVSLTREPK